MKYKKLRLAVVLCLALAAAACVSACVGMDEYWSTVSNDFGTQLPDVTPRATAFAEAAITPVPAAPSEKPTVAPTEKPASTPGPTAAPEPTDAPAVTVTPAATPEPTATPAPSPTPAAAESGKWNLLEYFADEAAFEAEALRLEKEAMPAFSNHLDALTGKEGLPELLKEYDGVNASLNRLYCYAQCRLDLNGGDAAAMTLKSRATGLSMRFSQLSTRMGNKLLAMGEAFWMDALADPDLAAYGRQLTKLKESAAHMLPDEQEALILPAEQALSNMMDTFSSLLYADLSFADVTAPDGGVIKADYTNYTLAMENPDRAYRAAYMKAFRGAYAGSRNTFAANLNAYVTLSEQLAQKHAYASVFENAMENEEITGEIYDALIEAGRESTDVLRRDNDIRRRALGYDELYDYDMRLPIGHAEAKAYPYADALAALEKALSCLGPDYTADLDKAFTAGWIDAFPGENKDTGAYSGMAVDIHPWVLLNYIEDYDSLSTAAHELGHAVHQYRSDGAQRSGYNKNPTALVSEVASITNQLLLSRYMISHATDDQERLYYLQKEFSLYKNAFFGQIQFADFERQMHIIVEKGGALTADGLDEIYRSVFQTYNPEQALTEGTESYWAAVPHFYYNYYVQDYAIATAVAGAVADGVLSGDAEMLKNYRAYLSAGNSQGAKELFATLGIDLTDPSFVKPLIARCNELLDEIQRLVLPA